MVIKNKLLRFLIKPIAWVLFTDEGLENFFNPLLPEWVKWKIEKEVTRSDEETYVVYVNRDTTGRYYEWEWYGAWEKESYAQNVVKGLEEQAWKGHGQKVKLRIQIDRPYDKVTGAGPADRDQRLYDLI